MEKIKRFLLITIILIIPVGISIFIEKFIYPNVIFDLKRAGFVIWYLYVIFFIVYRYEEENIKISKRNVTKIISSILISFIVFISKKNIYFFIMGSLEVLLIFFISNLIEKKWKYIGQTINDIVLLLYNIQSAILILANTFITRTMISNLVYIEDLMGNFTLYISSALIIIAVSLIPIKKTKISYKSEIACIIVIASIYVYSCVFFGNNNSVMYGYADLIEQEYIYRSELHTIKKTANKEDFYREEINDYRKKARNIPEKPNIIIIFTEGLSTLPIEDERNIMCYTREYESKSLSFENYYNHTFATNHALIGQLYSGFQYDNFENNKLVSIQEIFKDNGYHTSFINVEPINLEFKNYLKEFKFTDFIEPTEEIDGNGDTYSDKVAYETLYNTAIELEKEEDPFMLAMYTVGTHISFDGIYNEYGDGFNKILNKFYDMDIQFGEFMDKFNRSELAENTIIVFTADHGSVAEVEYKTAFENHNRNHYGLDKIPFFIYYKGMKPERIDARCRTSIDFAPTVLDYLDITAPNYFLGESLFSGPHDEELEHFYRDDSGCAKIYDDTVYLLTPKEEKDIKKKILRYFSISADR